MLNAIARLFGLESRVKESIIMVGKELDDISDAMGELVCRIEGLEKLIADRKKSRDDIELAIVEKVAALAQRLDAAEALLARHGDTALGIINNVEGLKIVAEALLARHGDMELGTMIPGGGK